MYSSRNTTGALKESIDPIDSFDKILEARFVPEFAVASKIVTGILPFINISFTCILYSGANEQRKAVFSLKAKSGILRGRGSDRQHTLDLSARAKFLCFRRRTPFCFAPLSSQWLGTFNARQIQDTFSICLYFPQRSLFDLREWK